MLPQEGITGFFVVALQRPAETISCREAKLGAGSWTYFDTIDPLGWQPFSYYGDCKEQPKNSRILSDDLALK
jgi:hypothetical protein